MAGEGQDWHQAATATVASDGTATATIIPNAAGRYMVGLISVSVSAASSPSSVAKVYRDAVTPAQFIEGTNNGDADADTTVSLPLTTGQTLVCYWTGAAPGAAAILRVEGQFWPAGS